MDVRYWCPFAGRIAEAQTLFDSREKRESDQNDNRGYSRLTTIENGSQRPTYEIAKNGYLVFKLSGDVHPDILQYLHNLAVAVEGGPAKGLFIEIDSGGGYLAQVAETSRTIRHLREVKPVVAVVTRFCIGAAYGIAASCSRILASPSAAIGGIGNLMIHLSYQKLMEDLGYKVTPITFGQHKAEGNPYQDLTEQSREGLQAFIDSYGRQFMQTIGYGRQLDPNTVLERYGSGDVFIASQALERGLVDGIVDDYDALLARKK